MGNKAEYYGSVTPEGLVRYDSTQVYRLASANVFTWIDNYFKFGQFKRVLHKTNCFEIIISKFTTILIRVFSL